MISWGALRMRRLCLISVVIVWMIFCLQPGLGWAIEDGAGRIINLKGQVQRRKAQAPAWEGASVGQILDPGEAIQTGTDGWAAVLLADETLIQINRNTTFVLKEVAMRAGWLQQRSVAPASGTTAASSYELQAGEIWLRNKNKGASSHGVMNDNSLPRQEAHQMCCWADHLLPGSDGLSFQLG
jgi:hypothetical protein